MGGFIIIHYSLASTSFPFPRLQRFRGHGLDPARRFHHAVQADRRHRPVGRQVARQVHRRMGLYPPARADEVGNRFGLEFLRQLVEPAAVRPPILVRGTEVTAVKVGQFVNDRGVARQQPGGATNCAPGIWTCISMELKGE